MYSAKEVYKEFTKKVDGTINQLTSDIAKTQQAIASLLSLLAVRKDLFKDTAIDMTTLEHIANRENKYIDDIEYITRYGVATLLGNKMLTDTKIELTINIETFIAKVLKLNEYEAKLAMYKKFTISYNLFTYIKKSFNFSLSKAILRGYRYNIGARMSSIFIFETERTFSKNGNEIKVVDRGQSWQNLLYIAKTYSSESKALLDRYESKRIKQQEFITAMKEFTYPKTQHKWISYYTDDSTVWLKWDKYHCICKNRSIYQFKPSNYIHSKTRRVADAIKEEGTIDKVIESKDYGMQKKINIIRKMNNNYFKTFNKNSYDLQAS